MRIPVHFGLTLVGLLASVSLGAAATFTVSNTHTSGDGSLAKAISDANVNPGPDTIAFNIPGTGVHTLLGTGLPAITDPVLIDGTSQPGYAGIPLIELTDDLGGFSPAALNITAGQCTVRALTINQIGGSGSAIQISGPGGNTITGCYIGVSAQGLPLSIQPGGGNGIQIINAPNNQIGGAAPGLRNLISGNHLGVLISGTSSSNNVIQGNWIGTDISGTNATPNFLGVSLTTGASSNLIGGQTLGAGNLISGNGSDGLSLSEVSSNAVQGNFVGLDYTGQKALGNGHDGILLLGATANLIGKTNSAAANVISGNTENGIELDAATGSSAAPSANNIILGNLIGVPAPTGKTLRTATLKTKGAASKDEGDGFSFERRMPSMFLNGRIDNCNGIRITSGNSNWMGTTDPFTGYNTIASWRMTPGINILNGKGNSIGGGLFLGNDYYSPFIYNANRPGPSVSIGSVLPFSGYLSFSANMDDMPNDNLYVICYAPIVMTENDYGAYFGYRRGWQVIGSNFTQTNPNGMGLLFGTWPYNTTSLSITVAGPDGSTSTPSIPRLVIPNGLGDSSFSLALTAPGSSGCVGLISPYNAFWQVQYKIGQPYYNLGYGIDYSLRGYDLTSGFFRGGLGLSTGSLNFSFKNPLSLAAEYRISYGSGSPSAVVNTNGTATLTNAPTGSAEIVVEKRVQVVDTNTGQTNSVGLEIPMDLDGLLPQVHALIDADMEAFTAVKCDCTAWCGIAGATVNGVQTVVASGGKLGTCLEDTEVTITGPGGVNVSFPSVPIPRRKREKFSPAADGTWTVTVTICNQTKSCSITLP
jgi:hypothetical protein